MYNQKKKGSEMYLAKQCCLWAKDSLRHLLVHYMVPLIIVVVRPAPCYCAYLNLSDAHNQSEFYLSDHQCYLLHKKFTPFFGHS